MSKKITELKNPPISVEDFDEWKRNWDHKTPIPDKIHNYMKRVIFPKTEEAMQNWRSLPSKKL
jgi:hypothetical protein